MPEVSVIVPTYNRAGYIASAMDSIFTQSCGDYDIIVVDDGSTDETREVLSEWIDAGRIRYFYQENQGESAARNKALSEASGEYLTFLDSDDLFSPGKLRTQVDYLEGNPEVRFVHGGYSKFDDAGHDLGFRDVRGLQGQVYPDLLLQWKVLPAVPAVMIHHSLIDMVGGFDESLRHGPDLDLWRRIARVTEFGWVPGEMCKVRVHPGNISGDKERAVRSFERYLQKAFDDDPDLDEAFQKKALSKMYANVAQNLLGEGPPEQMLYVRELSRKAVRTRIVEWNAYLAYLVSLLPRGVRGSLYRFWKQARYRSESSG